MSHHYSNDNWHETMIESLKSRLPSNWSCYYYTPEPGKLTIHVCTSIKKNLTLGRDIEAAIAWVYCSPYRAASIILHKWLKGKGV